MPRPPLLGLSVVDAWLGANPTWKREGGRALVRSFSFRDFSEALAFVVRVGLLAEKRDHHPDVILKWGEARVVWTTHDAGGITSLDLEMACATAQILESGFSKATTKDD